MASTTKIRGITIELGADVTGINNALKGLNSQINDTQRQLKDVEKLLKLDPTNVDLLKQKQQLLNKSTDEYNTKLTALKKAQEEFADAAQKGDEKAQRAYDALQREIVETQDKLDKATKNSENFSVSLERMAGAMTEVSNKAKEVEEKTKALSAVGAAVGGSLIALGVKSMKAADDLNTLAQQSGFTTEELQKFEYASDLVDVSSDTIIGAVRKLKKNMASESSGIVEAFDNIGVSISDAGGMKDATTVFYEVLEALSQVRNETERDQIAMQLFGKSADELAGIIDDGGRALREYGDQAKIWSQDSIDAANEVNDMFAQLKADMEQTFLVTGAKVLEALMPTIEQVIDFIGQLLDGLASLDSDVLGIITTVALVVAAISPIAGLIADITLSIAGLKTLLPALTGGAAAAGTAATVAVGPWIALAAAVAASIYEIVTNWDYLKEQFQKGVDWIKDHVVNPVVDYFEDVKERWTEFWDNLKERCVNNINSIIEFINKCITAIDNLITKLNDSAIGQALGLNIGTIGTIPKLGNGGVVSEGGSALVGESGTELLTVNQGQAMVQPLTTNNINNVYNQMTDRPVEMVVNLDGMQVARQIYNPMQRVGALAGGSCIK